MKFKSEVQLEALNNATVDTDKFLVSDSTTVKYRTGAEVLSDIGAVSSVTATGPITSTGGATPNISTLIHTNKLVGRSTAGTGAMEEISIGSGLGLSGGVLSASALSGSVLHGTASGTDTYTVTITGATAYADGDAYLINFTNGNTTSCTLDINAQGAKTLYRNNNGALIGGDIIAGGEMLCVYNSTLDGFQCIGTAPNTLLAYVTNAETSTITKGQAVYVSGGVGDRIKVKLAYNTSDATSAQTIGIVLSTSIAANQKGLIIVQGQLDNLSLFPTTTWADGDFIYLGATAGTLTNVKPVAPNHLVYLGYVTTASSGSSGRMYVKVQNGYEMDELHDVYINPATLANGDLLQYNSATDLWLNKSLSAAGIQPALPAFTSGSVIFSNGTTLAQDNANLFWDDTNNRLGIGTATPTALLTVAGDALINLITVGRGPGNDASNTVVGRDAFVNNLSGQQNTVIGYIAGDDITTGTANVLIGKEAGGNVNSGNGNTIIGANNSLPPTTNPADFSDTLSISKGESNFGVYLPHIWAPANVATSSTATIISANVGAYRAMFVEYVIEDENGNIRGGYIKGIWNSGLSVIKMTEDTTSSIGNTSNYVFDIVDDGSSNAALQITSLSTDIVYCAVTSRLLTRVY